MTSRQWTTLGGANADLDIIAPPLIEQVAETTTTGLYACHAFDVVFDPLEDASECTVDPRTLRRGKGKVSLAALNHVDLC